MSREQLLELEDMKRGLLVQAYRMKQEKHSGEKLNIVYKKISRCSDTLTGLFCIIKKHLTFILTEKTTEIMPCYQIKKRI